MLNTRAAIAANRFGLGARPGDAGRIGPDPAGWLLAQLAGGPGATAVDDRPASARVLTELGELRLARQAARSRLADEPVAVDPDALRDYAAFLAGRYRDQAAAMLSRAIASETPFRERLVGFWANHFAVSADKQPVGAIAGLYREEAIRPHVTGNFRDLLTAAIRHPAMLLYLDNQASIGPNSLLGRRGNRNRGAGLNENLAREILELHTLGVDGGYTQDDVIELARALTGWSVGNEAVGRTAAGRIATLARRLGADIADEAPGEFVFRAALHEPGSKTILGERFAEGGAGEAETVLDYLAGRPQTARFIAAKLARHFVGDAPPAALIEQLTRVYLDSDGELVPVYAALIDADAGWREPFAKYKTPEDYVVSVSRALGTVPAGQRLVGLATELGQRPLTPGSPAGWPDTAAHYNGGDALLRRIEWATSLGASTGDRIDAGERLDAVLGEVASAATRAGVALAESGAQAIALLFSSPEFQRR